MMKRRELLKLSGLSALSASCYSTSQTTIPRVNASQDRIIRTTVGLRPFRPTGFRVEAEKIEQKTIVHNYGHGGGGMSLSWGTSQLAVDIATATKENRFAILGSGVMGLSTGRLLQTLGKEVIIYSKAIPPNTTSNMSAAWWSPGSTVDPGKRTEAYDRQFIKAARFANRYYQNYVSLEYGVQWRPRYTVSQQQPESKTRSIVEDLFPEGKKIESRENPFPWPYVRRSWTMVIEPNVYLRALLRDFRIAGGRVVLQEFDNLEDILSLKESVILNCTGLGSRNLFNDQSLIPIKGQLSVLLPQPEIQYMMVGDGLYMIPRRDGLALGSTHERNEWSLEPSQTELHRVIEGHSHFWGQMKA